MLSERSWQAGAADTLLLHGVSSSSGSWWRMGPELARRGRTVRAVDLPGHGASERRSGALLPDEVAAEVTGSLDVQPLELLIGHSLGALVALEIAARWPERVRRLVLEEPPGPLSIDFPAMAAELEGAAREARIDPGAALQEMLAGSPRWDEADCRNATYDLIAFDDAYACAGLRRGPEWRTVSFAAAVTVPTLVLLAPDAPGLYDESEDSTTLRGRERADFLSAMPDADVRFFDTGHCIHRDDPTGWLRVVSEFSGGAS